MRLSFEPLLPLNGQERDLLPLGVDILITSHTHCEKKEWKLSAAKPKIESEKKEENKKAFSSNGIQTNEKKILTRAEKA